MIPETSPLPHYRKPLDFSAAALEAALEAATTGWNGLNSTIIMWPWCICSGRWKLPPCPPMEHGMALAVPLGVKMGVGQNLIDAK